MVAIKWQLILYSLRFVFLTTNAAAFGVLVYRKSSESSYINNFYLTVPADEHSIWNTRSVMFAVFIWACINDFYILSWDTFTYGSVFASVVPQVLTSLALMPMLALEIVFYANGPSIFIVVLLLFFLSTLILVTTITLWLQGPRSAWKLGIKDLQGPLPGRMGVSILGRKRSTNDNARSAWKEVIILLKTIIYRRIEDVESARYAVTRNTMAIILLTVLVAQSVILLGGVFAENYAAREVWRLPSQFYPADFCRLSIFYERVPNQTWSVHALSGSSTNVSTNDVLSTMTTCSDDGVGGNYSTCRFSYNESQCNVMATADIAIAVNITGRDSSVFPATGRIWVSYGRHNPNTRLYDHGIHFTFGYQAFGSVVEVIERRVISNPFLNTLGFVPTYDSNPITSIAWMERSPLNNVSIARVTLQFASPEAIGVFVDDRWIASRGLTTEGRLVRVIEDYRQHDFATALSSIGGLLAVLQGLHILCFGRPLFWGMLGSKLLNPFGFVGSDSSTLSPERMMARYGYSSESGTFTAEGLSLFLKDFVLDVGPLERKEDGVSEVEPENREGLPMDVYDAIPLEVVTNSTEDEIFDPYK